MNTTAGTELAEAMRRLYADPTRQAVAAAAWYAHGKPVPQIAADMDVPELFVWRALANPAVVQASKGIGGPLPYEV